MPRNHEPYDPMAKSTMDDDYTPRWYVLNEDGNIVPKAEPTQLSADTLLNLKLQKYAEEFPKDRECLSEYGRSLLG